MTTKARKYCVAFPCSNLAEKGSAYCVVHQPPRTPKETDRFYLTVRWRRFRNWYLRNHPFCEACEQERRGAVRAVMVDHIVELKHGGALTSEENAMAMCWKCHAIKTSKHKNNNKL